MLVFVAQENTREELEDDKPMGRTYGSSGMGSSSAGED